MSVEQLRSGLTGPFYRSGGVFMGGDSALGVASLLDIGLRDDRHCITVAAARTGKGSCVITPNVFRWSENLLLIDPKGETMHALRHRARALGQDVHVLDPMHAADWDRRASFNPLSFLDPDRRSIAEDIGVIVNAIVLRSDPKAAYWDTGAANLISGLIAFLIVHRREAATLPELKRLLNTAGEQGGAFDQALDVMEKDDRCAGLMQAAASKMKTGGNDAGNFLSTAETNTGWLNSLAMRDTLSGNSFDLDDLRTRPFTLCLVPDTQYIEEQGRFLRLFVELALRAMARHREGRRCLFILDEFHALGHMKTIATASGLMPGYGVKLWPFIQDLGQLQELYPTSWTSFFANASLDMFFGNTDTRTLQYLAGALGRSDILDEQGEVRTDAAARIDQLRDHIRKKPSDLVARRMICLVPGYEPGLSLRLRPWFRDRRLKAWSQAAARS